MTPFYDEPDEEAAIDTLRRSREIASPRRDPAMIILVERNCNACRGTCDRIRHRRRSRFRVWSWLLSGLTLVAPPLHLKVLT